MTVSTPPSVAPPRQTRRRAGWFETPGWPIYALFTWYPLWWVLGISEFAGLIFAVPMALELARRAPLRVPRGMGVWLLFMFWVVGGIVVLQVHAPGTQEGGSGTRYFTFGYRLLWYVAATVVLLYVLNTRKDLSNRRICQALGNMFVVVTLGGVLGALAPHLEFRSVLEYVLPGPMRSYGFVHSLIHPVTAQVQKFLGYEEARPSAPFAFTNEWGLAIACFLPFFVLSWCQRDAGWRRRVAPVVLLLAGFGAVVSLNRGLWLALGISALFIAVHYALQGHLRILALLLGGMAVLAIVVVASPLGALVLDRLEHPDSNQGRTNLGALTVTSVLHGSPVLGFGSTRNVQGNFSSIATATSTVCTGCSPPPLGTQGHLWLVLFSAGLVGLVLYLTFFVGQLLRHLRLQSPYAIGAQTVIVVHLVTMPVYDSIGPSLFAVMIAVGLLSREAVAQAEAAAEGPPRSRPRFRQADTSLARYVDIWRRQRWTLVALGVVGAALGAFIHMGQGSWVVATQSVLVPAAVDSPTSPTGATPPSGSSPTSSLDTGPAQTIDTYAQLVRADRVLSALQRTQPDVPRGDLVDRLAVSASPNTRILHISYTARTAAGALTGVQVVTTTYLRVLDRLPGNQDLSGTDVRVVSVATAHRSRDGLVVSAASGAMLAMSLGLIFGSLVGQRRSRVSRDRRGTTAGGLPVLARISSQRDRIPSPAAADLMSARAALDQRAVAHVVAVPTSAGARSAAELLEDESPTMSVRTDGPTAIVASTRSRLEDLTRLHQELDRAGQQVAGVVIVEDRR